MFYIYDKSSGFVVQASVLESYQSETDNMFLSALVTDPECPILDYIPIFNFI